MGRRYNSPYPPAPEPPKKPRPSFAFTLMIVLTAVFVLDAIQSRLFWESTIPSRLECVVRSADGCFVWADPERLRRYNSAQAGS